MTHSADGFRGCAGEALVIRVQMPKKWVGLISSGKMWCRVGGIAGWWVWQLLSYCLFAPNPTQTLSFGVLEPTLWLTYALSTGSCLGCADRGRQRETQGVAFWGRPVCLLFLWAVSSPCHPVGSFPFTWRISLIVPSHSEMPAPASLVRVLYYPFLRALGPRPTGPCF